jgi:3-dehydroquinate synthase
VSPSTIHVPIHEQRDASYDVIVGRGALADLPALLRERCPAHRYAIIADHHVAELHGAHLLQALAGLDVKLLPFPSGEWNKSRDTWRDLTDAMLAARFGRDAAVIAFGGGVAGDLAGFVAATYLRGVPYVQVPTTLLAMIDSSIGGKTGVDVPAGKNLVGAFHQPRVVLADIDLLATLPRVHVAAGAAEAVKHGIIADAAYASLLADDARRILAREPKALERAVLRSVAIKAEIVAQDEREAGVRAVLNFGHTVGHAVEACTGYELLHGEAVAIGMAAEARLAETLGVAASGLARDVARLLEPFGLPLALPETAATDALLEAMLGDKKVRRDTVRCALPARIGAMAQSGDGERTVEVDINTMRSLLEHGR